VANIELLVSHHRQKRILLVKSLALFA